MFHWASFLTYAVVTAVTPGPNNIMSMEAYILPFYSGQPLRLLGFALFLALIGFLFTLLWSAFGSIFKRLFSKHAKCVNTVMALLLVYCAASLFLR